MNISNIIDVPKRAQDKDQLGIENYKNGLSGFIKTAQTPLTIAIQGEWGSGKTSLMNSLRHDLCEETKMYHDVWINTWEYSLLKDEYSTMTNIIQGIIAKIIKVLEKDKNQNVENLKKTATRFFKGVAKGALKTASGTLTGGMLDEGIDSVFSTESNDTTLRDLHIELQKNINTAIDLSPNTKGFLFFIDDLDRINPPVAVNILELLKNIFDLENCIFLLAIDYEIVVKGLEPKFGKKNQENEREFRSFFEKIIQLPFTMPVGQYKIDSLIIDNLKELVYFNEGELTDDIAQNIVEINNLTVGSNPRSIKRLLNSLSLVKNIMLSVDNEQAPSAFEQLINIGVFSIQIAYPLVYRVLERFPDFTSWDDTVIETFKLKKLDPPLIESLKKNEYFDESWEQILYQICQKESYLSNRATQVSRLLNLIRNKIQENEDEVNKEIDSSGDVKIADVMRNAIQIASVTSYDDKVEETQIKEIHSSTFLKGLRSRVMSSFIAKAKDLGHEVLYNQKVVKSNLTFHIKKGGHNHRLDISIQATAKDYKITARYECWYFVRAITNDFYQNLKQEVAKSINAEERYNEMKEKMETAFNELPDNYIFDDYQSTNYQHNTVVVRMFTHVPNAWIFIKDEEKQAEYVNALVKFLDVVSEIKIVDLPDN